MVYFLFKMKYTFNKARNTPKHTKTTLYISFTYIPFMPDSKNTTPNNAPNK